MKKGLHRWNLVVKNPPANARDPRDAGLIPGWGISSGGGNGNPLQYFFLGTPMDRGACGLQSMGLQKSGMTEVTEHILTWVKKRGFCHEKVQSLARGKDLYVGSNSD